MSWVSWRPNASEITQLYLKSYATWLWFYFFLCFQVFIPQEKHAPLLAFPLGLCYFSLKALNQNYVELSVGGVVND